MSSNPAVTIIALASLLIAPRTLDAQIIGIRVDDRVQIDVDTTSTEQFWVRESPDLVNWTNHTFVDQSTSIDLGPPTAGKQFFRLRPLYGTLSWTQMPDMPVARDQFTGGVIDGKLYVFGGNGDPDGVDLSSLDIYDPAPANGIWDQGSSYTFGLEELTSAVVGGKLYVFGGFAGQDVNVTLCYDPIEDRWSEKEPKLIDRRQTKAVAWGDKILLLGGEYPEPNPNQEVSTTVQVYDTILDKWEAEPLTNIPEPLWAFGAGIHKNILYIVGGFSGGSVKIDKLIPHNKVHRYDLLNGIWLDDIVGLLPYPVSSSYSSSCPIVNGHMIIAGGGTTADGGWEISNWETDLVFSDHVLDYDIKANSFTSATSLPVAFSPGLVLLVEDKLLVCGGNAGNGPDTAARSKLVYIGAFSE